MSQQLFISIDQGHDSRNRIVYIAQDPVSKLYFVYKPRTGFKSPYYNHPDAPGLQKTFSNQLECSHTSVIPVNELEEITAPQTPPAGLPE